MQNLARQAGADLSEVQLFPLFKGPLVLLALGIWNSSPRGVFVVGDRETTIIQTGLMGSKVKKIVWHGPRHETRYQRRGLHLQIVIEERPSTFFLPRGPWRKRFEEAIREI
jgi:hypothetical protein